MNKLLSRTLMLTTVLIGIITFLSINEPAHAISTIRDGGATHSNGYRASPDQSGAKTHARDVDSSVKRAWERNQIIRGSKYPISLYNYRNKNNLIYDTYSTEWKTSRLGGEDFFVFDGWSVNKSYHHHHERNQATYIGVENKKTGEVKIFKTRMMSGTANNDIHFNRGNWRRCGNNEFAVDSGNTGYRNGQTIGCNMDYQMTKFRAYIPLNDLFGKKENDEWDFYIIKNVDGHLVYDELILPYSHKSFNWNNGDLRLDSGRNVDRLRITQDNDVIKRDRARGSRDLGRFRTSQNVFTKVGQNESTGIANWYGVRDKPNVGNRTVWTSSVYWEFGGSVATLSWKRTKFDVTINHVDVSKNHKQVLDSEVRKNLSGTQTFSAHSRDKYKTGEGYALVPVDDSKRVNVNRDMTIEFQYKASLPDPSKTVEVGGGENTHGHAEGKALWELNKTGGSTDIPDNFKADFEWINVTGGVEITNYIGSRKAVTIPSQLDGKDVVSIGSKALEKKGITFALIPDTVKTIGDYAFNDNSIDDIVVSNSITSIGKYAFSNNNLGNVVIPNSVKTIGDGAFRNNNITNFEFQDGIERIGNNAFRNNQITEVDLPESITRVDTDVFRDNNIELVLVHNDNTTFGSNVFANNQSNSRDLTMFGYDPSTAKSYATEYNHTFRSFENPENEFVWHEVTGGVEIVKYVGNDQDVGIPRQLDRKDVVSIGESSFYEKRLTSITIPSTVKEIGDEAFARNELTSLNIPNRVTKVGVGAFEENELTSATIPNTVIELGAFSFKDNNLTNVNIPTNLTSIEDSVFEANNLVNITIPRVESIGDNAFSGNNITNLEIPSSVKVIGNSAFAYNGLTELEVPETVDSIGEYAFRDNVLTKVVIPNDETEVKEGAFVGNMGNSYDLFIHGYSPSPAKDYANDYEHTFVDMGIESDYVWRDNSDGTVTITDYIGTDTDLVIPNKLDGKDVTIISVLSFARKDLTSVTLPNTLKEIQGDAFSYNNLKSVVIPDSVKIIGTGAFRDTQLESVDLGNGVETINGSAFHYNQIKEVNIPSSVTELDMWAFASNQLTNINLPKSVKSVGEYAFQSNQLTKVVVQNKDMTYGGDRVFIGNSSSITLYGYDPSTTKAYANDNGYAFIDIDLQYENFSFNEFRKGNLPAKRIVVNNENKFISGFKNLFGITKVNADTENEESELYAENNFLLTGLHYETRNAKHTLKVGNHTETSVNPIAILTEPNSVKDQNMIYDYEYEYTNHYTQTYKCVEKKGNDCFKWTVDKTVPAWGRPYIKKFKLSDTEGQFERYTTSRLAQIDNKDVLVYPSYTSSNGTKAGSGQVGMTYYVKEKAIKGNDVYYLLSNSPSSTSNPIGWVSELDLSTYTHYSMDSKSKKVKLTGFGSAYSRAWGGSKQSVTSLNNHANKTLNINLTETVGDNIWYRGTISGVSGNVWVHENHTDSIEVIQIKETPETLLGSAKGNVTLTLKMDHKHGETFEFEKGTPEKLSLLVSRDAIYDSKTIKKNNYNEEFTLDRKDTTLETQTWKDISEKIKYISELENRFYVIEGDKYYFPNDIDDNLQSKYENETGFDYSDYAIPLRVGVESDKEVKFLSEDSFFLTKKTGFLFSLQHLETSMNRINLFAKQHFEEYTNQEYDDTVISDPYDASRYYVNVDLDSEQEPNTKYDDNVVLGKLGLNDITVHLIKYIEFGNYLFGHYDDDSIFVEQKTNVIKDIDYTTKVTLNKEQIGELKQIEKERDGNIHSFRKTDDYHVIDEVKRVVP